MRFLFDNLRAELTRLHITTTDIANKLDVSVVTVNRKLRRANEFNLEEMSAIKEFLSEKAGKNFTLDYLFES